MRTDELHDVLAEAAGPAPDATSAALERVHARARRQRTVRRTLAVGVAMLVVIAIGTSIALARRSRADHRIVTTHRGEASVSRAWRAIPDPPFANPFASIVVDGRVVVAFGPGFLPSHMEFASFDPATNRWTVLPEPPLRLQAPFTASPTFVWTDRELIVWGYADGPSADSFDGAMRAMAFAPATQTWHVLPPPPIEGLIQATPVWTGREMLVWGGNINGADVPLQAAAYNPSSNTWRTLPPGPLKAREDPVAVWTGREMIIWGGFPGDDAQGAAFDPVTGVWRVLPPSGLSTRELASVVWTGRRLIVWSGSTSSAEGADGATYDPVANTWQPIAPAPVEGRHLASAVWTGTRMIVWGGQSYAGGRRTFADGASYDPATNTWSLLPASHITSRWGPVAAWIDGEMLVVGGYGPARPGASSEPSLSDAWTYRPTP